MRIVLKWCALLGTLTLAPRLYAATDWATHPAPFAKKLAEKIVKSQPDLLDAIFHVTPPHTGQNVAVAAHTAKEQGSPSGVDDLSVITTGKPLVEVQKDGVRIGVVLPLQDHHRQTIGALGLMYVFHHGDKEQEFLARSEKIRDNLAREISSQQALFQTR